MSFGWFRTVVRAWVKGAALGGVLASAVVAGPPTWAQEKNAEPLKANEAQTLLLLKDHLKKITEPVILRYSFERKSDEDDSFSDKIDMKIDSVHEDGSKDISFEFFTGERRRPYSNVSHFRTNAVFMMSITRDIWQMAREVGGHAQQASYFGKRINFAIRKDPKIETITIDRGNGPIKAKKVTVQPFLGDPNVARFKKFEKKIYEFVFSEDVPGEIYLLHTIVPAEDDGGKDAAPKIEETTRFEQKLAHK